MPKYLKILDKHGGRIPIATYYGGYEGATTGRRMTSSWGTAVYGPNAALSNNLALLRSRSREMARNNALASGAIDSFVSSMVGSGIVPRWQIKDNIDLKEEVQELWNDSIQDFDVEGQLDFYGQQSLAARSMIESGECFVQKVYRRSNSGLLVPIQFKILEPDLLDETYNVDLSNGNIIRMGIEFNRLGERIAYHMYQDHPGEYHSFRTNSYTRKRIPARYILHLGRPLRPGQIRYRPWLSSVLLKLRDIDQCDDAELVRRKTTAMFGGFFTRSMDTDAGMPEIFGDVSDQGSGSADLVGLEPGTFTELPPGFDVQFSQPHDVSGNYLDWIRQQLRTVARGLGVSYEQLSGDLENVNYSSIRAGLTEFRRMCTSMVNNTIIRQLCRPVAQAWLESAVLTGAISIPDFTDNRRKYYRIKWQPEAFDWVDPAKEQEAYKDAVRCGFMSRDQVIATLGSDAEVVDAQNAADNERADRYGLIYDSDPRRTAKNGAKQNDGTDADETEEVQDDGFSDQSTMDDDEDGVDSAYWDSRGR